MRARVTVWLAICTASVGLGLFAWSSTSSPLAGVLAAVGVACGMGYVVSS
jgi:hypothetical protein